MQKVISAEEIYQKIKERILNFELLPGQQLSENVIGGRNSGVANLGS